MPKLFGNSLLAILAATIVFYMVGYLWYGVLFAEQWVSLSGMTQAEAIARNEELGAMMFVWGLLITLVQVLGLGAVLNWASASLPLTCAKIGLIVSLLIATPVIGYSVLYADSPIKLMLIDASHLIVGYVIATVILGLFRKS